VTGGIATIIGTGISFVPTVGVCGTGYFTYFAVDASGGMSNLATGTVSIACVNTAPVAVNQSLSINEDNTGSINFLSGATDADAGDTIALSGIVIAPSNGTITTG